MAGPRRGWGEALSIYRDRRVLTLLCLGFSAGLPFLLVFSTLSIWLREAAVERSAIGFFSWVGITYSIKVVWAPVLDSLQPPVLGRLLGRRRGWMLLAICGIAAGLVGMAYTDPATDLWGMAAFALLVAFSSATQDVALDAYRIEVAPTEMQGALAAAYQLGYRVAILFAGAGALHMAERTSWTGSYLAMAALTLVGFVTVLLARREPQRREPAAEAGAALPRSRADRMARWVRRAVWCPFADFFGRTGWLGLVILVFIGSFRISDIAMASMIGPLYVDLGFSKAEIANVVKVFGLVMTIVGAALGGVMVARYGLARPLVLAAVLVALTNLPFAGLALAGHDLYLLAGVIAAENLTGGLSGSIFIAYLSSLTSANYTATQYALFSSLMTLPGKFIGGFSGIVAEDLGYPGFFVYSACLGVPAIALALYLMRHALADLRSREDGDAGTQTQPDAPPNTRAGNGPDDRDAGRHNQA